MSTAIYKTAIGCGDCHAGAVQGTTAPSTHLDGDLDVLNGYPVNVAKGGAPYDSCSTSYCHGDTLKFSTEDMNDGVGAVDVSPTWGDNLIGAGNGCDFCHGYPPVGDIGAGPQHPTSTDCSACHDHVEPINDLSFVDASKHIDGTVQITGGENCVDCHGSGKYKDPTVNHPDHSMHTDVDAYLTGKTLPGGDYGNEATGWYGVTYDANGKMVAGCGQCHPGSQASHPSGGAVEIDLDPAGETITGNSAKKLNSSPTYTSSKCNNVYCHSNGAGSFVASPTWDTTAGNANLTCASCHLNSPDTNAHSLHEVGIHYEELYDDDGIGLMAKSTRPADMTASGGADAAHGNGSSSTTITCITCHSNTVQDSANAGNTTCASCHSDTNTPLTGNELARIKFSSSSHLNGVKDVAFSTMTSTFKSKAQVRDDITKVTSLDSSWTRTGGYKAGTASYDLAKVNPSWNGTSCSTVACHNGNSIQWNAPSGDCTNCHTTLP